jgi:hypothetical protein
MNNIALFVTHSVFLTDEEARLLASGESSIETTGHCVPVWVEAKTGKTTEPGNEIFCRYKLHNSKDQEKEIKIMPRKGYEIFLPHCSSWSPPTDFDYEKISVWPSEERVALMKEIDRWWFSNPRPPDASDIAKGYLRFDLRRTDRKGKKSHQEQHVIEISTWDRLTGSLAT